MWKAIIEGEKRKLIENKLCEITKDIEKNFSFKNDFGVLSGNLGIAIYYFYYSLYFENEKYADLGINILKYTFENINKVNSSTFSDGYSGIGWCIEHLVKEGFVESETSEILMFFDNPLKKEMLHNVENGLYDFISGALGEGMYFISRSRNSNAKKYLNKLIIGLYNSGIKDYNCGLKWHTIINPKLNLTGCNLGLSHGLSSIIAFCNKLMENKIHIDGVKKVLEGAVNYILCQKEVSESRLSIFPNFIIENLKKDNSRLAWCYGDLGIGITLWRASRILKDKDLEMFSIKVLINTTKRKNLKINSVSDSIFCHGTSGIAHIYNRMYNYTLIKDFKLASIYWFDETLKMAKFQDGYAGYKTYVGNNQWSNNLGMLEGVTGVGLALISAVSDIEPKWDECLLLS